MEIEMIRIVGSLAISVLFLAPVILSEYSRKKKDKEMTEKEGVTIVMTTHDTSLMGAGDVVYELEDGKLL